MVNSFILHIYYQTSNATLRTATRCRKQHIVLLQEHIKLHASQIRKTAHHPSHPLQLSIHIHTTRLKKQTTFNMTRKQTNYLHKPRHHYRTRHKYQPHNNIHHHHLAKRQNNKLIYTTTITTYKHHRRNTHYFSCPRGYKTK